MRLENPITWNRVLSKIEIIGRRGGRGRETFCRSPMPPRRWPSYYQNLFIYLRKKKFWGGVIFPPSPKWIEPRTMSYS